MFWRMSVFNEELKKKTPLHHFIVSEKKQVAPRNPSPSYLETCMATHTQTTSAHSTHPLQESEY